MDDGLTRRSFVRRAVAAGGIAGLAACSQAEEAPDLPRGPEDLSGLPERQHAWNAVTATDEHGNPVQPRHRVFLLLDYAGDGPTDAERERVEAALASLERSYPRGNDGLLVTVGYSPRYFGRFDVDLPASVDLPEPRALAPFEEIEPDRPDAVVDLASDHGQVVLAAERALLGERDALNGRATDADLAGLFEVAERRTGFVGEGLPADNQDVRGIPGSEPVPEEAPLYMGFTSGFAGNQASEDRVTIQSGPFAGGTTQHLSLVRLHLDQWYGQDDREHRVATMFSPAHAEEERAEGTGRNLGDDTGMVEQAERTAADARERGVVGHSQKTARAREDGEPVMIRRDVDATTDGQASLHFLALQREIADFVKVRAAMNGTELAEEGAVGRRANNGILQYMTVERRGNYLVPPRHHRALPTPRPEGA